MEQNTYKVYARLDSAGNITAVHSSAFLDDHTDWTLIDEGTGDRYHHAQGNYLDGGLYTPDGIHLYRWDGTQVIHRTEEEIEADRAAIPPVIDPQEDTDAMLVDHELRLALLELGGI